MTAGRLLTGVSAPPTTDQLGSENLKVRPLLLTDLQRREVKVIKHDDDVFRNGRYVQMAIRQKLTKPTNLSAAWFRPPAYRSCWLT